MGRCLALALLNKRRMPMQEFDVVKRMEDSFKVVEQAAWQPAARCHRSAAPPPRDKQKDL